MPNVQMSTAINGLRRAFLVRDGGGMSDGQLLDHFLKRGEEAAFEALVKRHGPMVLSVCRRVLNNAHDAEDAFQATFLVLVRKARSILSPEMVGSWLHGVAYRTAVKARALAARRRVKEKEMSRPEALEEDTWLEIQPLLDQELSRLPDKYRVPMVLCDLEGKTRKEAARQLGWPEGTLSGRLSRARVMVARRLARRGLSISGGALALTLAQRAHAACLSSSLLATTVKTAAGVASGRLVAGMVPAKVAVLTEGVVKAMLLIKLKKLTAVVMLLGMLGLGAAGYQALAAEQDTDGDAASQPAPSKLKKAPKEESLLPGRPMSFTQVLARSNKDGSKITLEMMVTVTRYRLVQQKLPGGPGGNVGCVFVPETKTEKRSFVYEPLEVYDTDGKKVSKKALKKRLAKEVPALLASCREDVDPLQLRLFKKDTLIFVVNAFPPAPAFGPGGMGAPQIVPPPPLPALPGMLPGGGGPPQALPPAAGPNVPRLLPAPGAVAPQALPPGAGPKPGPGAAAPQALPPGAGGMRPPQNNAPPGKLPPGGPAPGGGAPARPPQKIAPSSVAPPGGSLPAAAPPAAVPPAPKLSNPGNGQ